MYDDPTLLPPPPPGRVWVRRRTWGPMVFWDLLSGGVGLGFFGPREWRLVDAAEVARPLILEAPRRRAPQPAPASGSTLLLGWGLGTLLVLVGLAVCAGAH